MTPYEQAMRPLVDQLNRAAHAYYDLDEPSDLFHEVDAAIVDTLRNGEITFSPMLYADSPKTIDGFVYTASKDTTPQDAAEYLINLLLEDLQTENPQRSFKITNVFNLVIGAPTALDENTWTIKIAGQFLFTGLIHYISIDESDLHHTHFLYAQYKMVKTGNTYTLYAS